MPPPSYRNLSLVVGETLNGSVLHPQTTSDDGVLINQWTLQRSSHRINVSMNELTDNIERHSLIPEIIPFIRL